MNHAISTLLVLILIFQSGYAQSLHKIDSVANNLIARYSIPGIAILGARGNQVAYSKTFGIAKENVPLSDSSRLYIASNTKAFIGLAMTQLAQQKKLDYADPITDYIETGYFPPYIKAKDISIANLLTHTHGLSNDPLVFRTAFSGEYPSDLRELLAFTVYKNDSASTDFNYSNLGYLLAAMIIEEVTGMKWKEYLQKEIMSPLNMDHTTMTTDYPQSQEVLPYSFLSKQPLSSAKSDNTLHAAGGIYTTLEDMSKWLRVFTNDGKLIFDEQVITAYLDQTTAIEKKMGPFQMQKYGNGWIHGSFMGQPLNFHFGSFHGYESMMSFMPGKDLAVYVFVNEKAGGQRVAAMLSVYYYLLMTGSPMAPKSLEMFGQMIAAQYKTEEKDPAIFTYSSVDDLSGVYLSDEYGQLIVDHTPAGYTFQLGKLKSLAYQGTDSDQVLLEWTPGIEEHFTIKEKDGVIELYYGECDVFKKR